ncbi:MAG TPA: hypothetical protein PLV25_06320, partial [Opitutales bacterium]|nr:hypothetical protein [Opitutales bacterium]
PVKWLPENVEMFLVAAIVALGIRFYFIQPFKIPTNSMWPTYAGMVPTIYPANAPEPTVLERARNTVMAAASHYSLTAPASGAIEVPLFTPSDRIPSMGGQVKYQLVKGRKWFGLLPAMYREYVLYVNGKPTDPIRVPYEFSLDDVILKRFILLRPISMTSCKALSHRANCALYATKVFCLKRVRKQGQGSCF